MIFLLIGLGSIAQKHIAAITLLYPDSVFIALRSSKSGTSIPGVKDIFQLSDLEKNPDYILITNPTFLHEKAIIKCLGLGKPMMIEKPLFSDIYQKETLLESIKKHNIPTYVACNMRFHPSLQFLKKLTEIRSLRINEVNVYCGSYLPNWRKVRNFRDCYSANADMGGGVHLDLIHEIDYCTWLFDMPFETRAIRRNSSSLEISAADFGHYLLLYKNFCINITLNYYRRTAKRGIEIITDDAVFECDLLTSKVTENGKEIFFDKEFTIKQTYIDQMRFFLSNINCGKPIMNNVDEAFSVLKLALYE